MDLPQWAALALMPADELRQYPARLIAEAHPLVARARGQKHPEGQSLTISLSMRPGHSEAQERQTWAEIHAVLSRWVWDGWAVAIEADKWWARPR